MIHIRIPKTLFHRLVEKKNSMPLTPTLTSLVRGLVEMQLDAEDKKTRRRPA